ncbi:uncharacterized protein BO97DRAFT_446457 [Aspergillus homomorphus CBS 101889]|uniref:Uncharacterized protein n=1 Tax=Aspergillus homomorphus (strain CBS 101889) TaxID=1450537 RepID=A0A395HLH3_ASPHC|nr:hypothetical protein BO97DRAFT_446457 [Aspergillus homomorphus CBS 101889]RAL08075.1 hypothetical protein BO97DRAFT_446457 [Aspergillus homomorphus CBS 101889]
MATVLAAHTMASAAITLAVLVPFIPPAMATAKLRANRRASLPQLGDISFGRADEGLKGL